MTSAINQIWSVTSAANQVDFSTMSKDELTKWLQDASQKQPLDISLVNQYLDALKTLEQKTSSLDKTDISKMSRAEIRDFAKHQIAAIRGSNDIASKSKEYELIQLLDKLNNEKNNSTKILTNNPSLKEYFSLKRRRNARLLGTIENLKKQPEYPKNVLIYAMGITSSKYFGAGQSLKRGVAKLTWNWKSENIRAHIDTLIQKCQPNPTDSERKKATKEALLQSVREAKDAYINKLKIQNSF